MNYYEIVFMIHPNFSDKINGIVEYYSNFIKNNNGHIHHLENWGCRPLAYSIKKNNKAYYVLMNIEISQDIINKLKLSLQFNSTIIRNLIIKTKCIKDQTLLKIKE